MRVVFNQLSTLRAKTGVGEYTHRLMAALCDDGVHVGGIPSGLVAALYRWGGAAAQATSTNSAASDSNERWYQPRVWLREIKRHGKRQFERQARYALSAKRCDVYHEPNFLALEAEAPTVVTVHDLSVLLMPEHHPADRIREYERHFEKSLARAAHVVTVSETIRQEVIRFLNYPAHKVTAVLNGVRPGLRRLSTAELAPQLKALNVPNDYLLYVGTLEPRKNVLQLMQIYCDLPAKVRERCPLVLAGGWGWNYQEIAKYYEDHARHKNVLHLGYVADESLLALYNGARALVSPSYYEGFGLPTVEMLACGGAVLASRIGASVEVVGGQAHLVPPDDRDGWRAALQRIIVDDDWRNALCKGAANSVARFTWQRCARATLAVYRQVVGQTAETALGRVETTQTQGAETAQPALS